MWPTQNKMNNILKYTVAAILVAIPLYPKFPFLSIPGTFVAIRLEDLLIAFATLVLVAHLLSSKSIFKLHLSPLNQAIMLYVTIGLISVVSAIFITKTVDPLIGVLHWIRRVEYFIPYVLGVYAIYVDRRNLNFFVNILFIVVIIVFVYGVGQKYLQWPIIITQNEEYSKGAALRYVPGGHINSTFAGHYDLGTFLVLALPLLICVAAFFKDKYKYIYGIGFLSGLWLLVNTASRVSLASYLLSTLLALMLLNKKLALIVVIGITVVFTFSSNNLIDRYQRIIDVAGQKLNLSNLVVSEVKAQERSILPSKKIITPTPTSIPVFEDRSSNIRLNVEWPRAIRAFYKNPLVGTGYSSITLATDNDYLRLLGEVGVLGFLAFLLIILRIVLEFIKKIPFASNFSKLELVYIVSVFASIPGVLLNAVFIDVFEASKFAILFWLMMGFAIGLLTQKENYAK